MCKIKGFWKWRWLAGSKLCSQQDVLSEEDLYFGQKVCRLPRPSPARRQHVEPKIEALWWRLKGGNVDPHIFSTPAWKLSRRFRWVGTAPEYRIELYSNTGQIQDLQAVIIPWLPRSDRQRYSWPKRCFPWLNTLSICFCQVREELNRNPRIVIEETSGMRASF